MAESTEDIVANAEERKGWLWLENLTDPARDRALEALVKRDAADFLLQWGSHLGLKTTFYNQGILRRLGILEDAFFEAVTGTNINNHVDYSLIGPLVETLDCERLRDAGDPLPGSGPWTIYRGVAGKTSARRKRGYSWTQDRERAEWFAKRYEWPDRAVYRTSVKEEEILFYTNVREEEEFFVKLPPRHHIEKVLG